ncbi:MAG: hypothetical protein ACK5PB_02285 [Pirellula sp.]
MAWKSFKSDQPTLSQQAMFQAYSVQPAAKMVTDVCSRSYKDFGQLARTGTTFRFRPQSPSLIYLRIIQPPKSLGEGRVEFTITRGGFFKGNTSPPARARDRTPVNAPEALAIETPIPPRCQSHAKHRYKGSRGLGMS